MAQNRKEAMLTGGGSPAQQEELDALEERVAAVIPNELVVGIAGQDSAQNEEPQGTQGHATPTHEQEPLFEADDEDGDSVPSMDIGLFQDLLQSIQTPSPSTRTQSSIVGSPLDQHGSTRTPPPTTSHPHHSQDTLNVFEQRVVDVQGQLAQEVRKGIESMGATLEGVLHFMQQRHKQMPNTSASLEVANRLRAIQDILEVMNQKQDAYLTNLAAYQRDVAAVLVNQQVMLSAFIRYLMGKEQDAGTLPSTSAVPDVCMPPMSTAPVMIPSAKTTHTSAEEDFDECPVLRKTAR
ncbi:uncharacterized protein LOC144752819 [Lissotriton helveticus]